MKKIIIGAMASIFLITIIASLARHNSSASNETETISPKGADKIEVIHFHGNTQCPSCLKVGQYALKTIQEKFPEEYKNGKITFKDINGELQENQDEVLKCQARGSSLFVNYTTDGQETVEEDTTVWRLVSDEQGFRKYFENKLKMILGK